jgi:broad specificity phosphatase PhoE
MPVSPTRRAVLQTIAALVVLAVSVVLAGCGTGVTPTPGGTAGGVATTRPAPGATASGVAPSTRPTPEATANPAAPSTLVMLIRHGEKPDGSHPGVDANGNQDASSLTETGWTRAHRLVDLFDPTPGPPRPGLARPTTIYAAGANDEGEGTRTRETVTPLADKLGITVDTSFGKNDEEALVEHAISQPGPTLISWQHGEIPAIAAAFPSVKPKPPSEWPDDRFDVIWTFTKTPDGWHFAQMPELVLPDDQPDVIKK